MKMYEPLALSADPRSRIQMDWNRFDPGRVQELEHDLTGHPLLQLDSLVELGKRLEASARIYTFNNKASAAANFDSVARAFPNRKSATATLEGIKDANAWMLLRHVQSDPIYRPFVAEVLDGVGSIFEDSDPGMYYRAAWIFVSSPHTVTPFHIDRNHGLLLQISGSKKVHTWEPDDSVVSAEAREHFHYRRSLALVTWREEFRERARTFQVRPGTGVYLPVNSPHMVETGEEPSITISFSYNTLASRRNVLLHAVHGVWRRIGLVPPAIGARPRLDSLMCMGAESLLLAGGSKLLSVSPEDGRRAYFAAPD